MPAPALWHARFCLQLKLRHCAPRFRAFQGQSGLASCFINEKLIPEAKKQDLLLVHPHCQRTGGGAFRTRVLVPVFGEDKIYARLFVPNAKRWSRLTEADLAPYRAYTDLHNYTGARLSRPSVGVALIRDPVYRAVSIYHYVRRRTDHPLHASASQLTLEDFYRRASSRLPTYFRNVQCRRICGIGDAQRAISLVGTRYIGVGFTTRLPEFVSALAPIFGWPKLELISRGDDVERYGAQATTRFRAMVLADNREDQILFETFAAGPPYLPPRRSPARAAKIWVTEARTLSLAAMRRIGS